MVINAAETGDPGEKSEGKIFSISCKKDGEDGFYDILNKYPDPRCLKTFTAKTISSLSEYINTRGSSREYSKSNSLDVHGGLFTHGFFDSSLFTETRSFCLFFSPIVNSSREEAADSSSTHCSTHCLLH